MPLPRLVEVAVPEERVEGTRRPETVIAFSRWVYRIPGFRDNCLEKSLLTYRYLPADGGRYRLVLGVRGSDAEGPPGHAWLTIDGVPVHDNDESLADLVPIVAFDSAGRREEVDSAGGPSAGTADRDERGKEPQEKRERPPHAG
jgi:transglutaminase superfamily protein